jgi:predicted MFS family arabinose efflux permease
VDSAVLTLNALLGLGTVAAPVFVAVFVGLGFWWGLPAVSAALLAFLLLASIRLPLRVSAVPAARASRAAGRGMPARFWLYAVLIGLYGICETMNGNWSQLEMTGHVRASTAAASLALAAFWGMVTLGRVLFALIDRWLPAPAVYRLLPLVLIISFLLTGLLAHGQAGAGIFVFALAGLGCSALLPLTISFGERDMTAVAPAVSGGVIAFYQVGYGIAAFSVGPLLHAGISLPEIFAGTAAAAAVLGVLATAVARRQRAVPAAGHTGHAGHAGALPSAASRGAGEVTRPRSG